MSALLTGLAGHGALGYAHRGWPVFPLRPGGKIPLIPSAHPDGDPLRGRCHGECGRDGHGLHDAALDPATIRAWWKAHPDANVGIRTGAASGLLVVDVDYHHGGGDTLARLEADHHGEPALITLEAETPNGGAHLLFAHPGQAISNSTRHIRERYGPGIDLRCDGGYIAVWPSTIVLDNGQRRAYRWCTGHPQVEPAPAWLLDLLRPAEEPARLARRPPPAGPHPTGHQLAARFGGILDRLGKATEGERNRLTHWSACRLAELLDDGAPDGWVELLAEAGRRTGLDDREVRRAIASGFRERTA